MSLLAITDAGVLYKDAVFAGEEVQNITRVIFRNVTGLVPETAIDLTQGVPTSNIVHSQPIERVGALDDNAIVMSTVLGYDTGNFEYNWYGVVAQKADLSEVLIAVVQTPIQTKTKTNGPITGNYSAKSVVWKTANIAQELNVSLSALPWQVPDNTFVTQAAYDLAMTGKLDKTAKATDVGAIPDSVRLSKINNPLVHILKKNKIVEALKGYLSWTRPGFARYIDRYGTLKTAGTDEPREEANGWLIEGESTNISLHSEEFGFVGAWNTVSATITENQAIAPDGSLTADLLDDSEITGKGVVSQVITASQISDSLFTFSVYLKKGTALNSSISVTAPNISFLTVGLEWATLTLTGSASSLAKLDIVGNGWVRLSLSPKVTYGTVGNGSIRIYACNSDEPDAVTGSVYIWGAQLEELPFASSYIPTTNDSATRAADIVVADTQYDSERGDYSVSMTLYNQSIDTGITRALYHGNNTSYAQLALASNDTVQFNAGMSAFPSTPQILGINNIVSVMEGGTAKLYNNSNYAQDVDIGERKEHNQMTFGSINGSNGLFGHILDFRIYDFALTADEVKFLGEA